MSNNRDNWLKGLPLDALPEAHRKLAEVIGVEAMIDLCREYGGLQTYIPTLDALDKVRRNQQIRAHYNGSNTEQLAKRFGLTDRAVRMIVDGIAPQPIKGQITMFDSEKE